MKEYINKHWRRLDDKRDISSNGIINQRATGIGTKPLGQWSPSISTDGRRSICVDGRQQMFSRVMWEVFVGPIPAGLQVDHINGDRSDDRIENYRIKTPAKNRQAFATPYGVSSYRGVCKASKGKPWQVEITANHKYYYCGTYNSEHDAARAWNAKATSLGFAKEALNQIPAGC